MAFAAQVQQTYCNPQNTWRLEWTLDNLRQQTKKGGKKRLNLSLYYPPEMPTVDLCRTSLCLSLTSQRPKIHFSLSTNSFRYSFRPKKFHFLKPCSSLKETKKQQQTISKSPTNAPQRLLNLNLKRDDENESTESESDGDNAVKGTILAGLLLVGVVGGFGGIGYVYRDQINAFLNQFSGFIEGKKLMDIIFFVLLSCLLKWCWKSAWIILAYRL